MYYIPHYRIINTKIIVDNDVPEIFHLPPSNDGVSLSDMNQAFFHERKITGLDSPAGNKINFLFEQIL